MVLLGDEVGDHDVRAGDEACEHRRSDAGNRHGFLGVRVASQRDEPFTKSVTLLSILLCGKPLSYPSKALELVGQRSGVSVQRSDEVLRWESVGIAATSGDTLLVVANCFCH